MFDWANWFRSHLQASGEGLVWAFARIDPRYHLSLPPAPPSLGEWSPARHVWHVTGYERWIALPSMCQWLGGPLPDGNAWPNDDAAWSQAQDAGCQSLTAAFQEIRQQQIDLLDQLSAVDWDEPHETLWGDKPLSMVVTKTYQHTLEHCNTLLRMGLWWEDIERRQSAGAV
ncbi:MAG: DinB family protein [Chloroflexi bacterium]|nr:DinB family protein [Chloroflexota bacterium]